MPVLGASTFGKHHNRHIVLQRLNAPKQTAQRHTDILRVYRNLTGTAQVPAHERITKKRSLGQNSELKRQLGIDHRDIERGKMINHIDMSTAGIDLFQSFDMNRSPD